MSGRKGFTPGTADCPFAFTFRALVCGMKRMTIRRRLEVLAGVTIFGSEGVRGGGPTTATVVYADYLSVTPLWLASKASMGSGTRPGEGIVG